MIIKEVLREAENALRNKDYITRPKLEAEILLAFVLKCERVFIHTHINDSLQESTLQQFRILIDKRATKGMPIEYLTEEVNFYSEKFYITEGVLIPRPETEILIDKALLEIQRGARVIAEIGVGSGIISIMLSYLAQQMGIELEIYASDISQKALFVANNNCKRFKCQNIHLFHAPFLDFSNQHFDLLLSNPPYISNTTLLPLPLNYEPKEALFSGDLGLECIYQIILCAKNRKIPKLICEIGSEQREAIIAFSQKLDIQNISFYKDLSNLDRGFVMEL